jgi:hypothetical protein
MRFFQKAPTAVYELNDEQVERWREGDDSVWNEDSKGRPLSFRALTAASARNGGTSANGKQRRAEP